MVKPSIEQARKVTVPREAIPFLQWGSADQMTCRQAAILKMIEHNPGCTVGAIAHVMNIPKPSVTRAADKLTIMGLVHRKTEPADHRLVQLWPGSGKPQRRKG
jgi:DNA-binding MarR family transcriptional regulator